MPFRKSGRDPGRYGRATIRVIRTGPRWFFFLFPPPFAAIATKELVDTMVDPSANRENPDAYVRIVSRAATEIIFISIRTLVDDDERTPHCRLVRRDPLLIGGSYERDDRQVEISYRWLSAHYANIHSESQPDILSRSCLSRFAKAFLRPCLSLSLSRFFFLHTCATVACIICIYVCVGRLCHFWTTVCFARPLSRNHIRICDHVTAYRLDFVSRDIYTHPSLLRVVKRFSNRCSCHAGFCVPEVGRDWITANNPGTVIKETY